MNESNILLLLLTGAFVGAASGYIGSFMVLKRMSLVGDALSHVALPGIALALTWHINPMIGAFIALTFATIGVWFLEQTSSIYPEALVGLFFTGSLALGILITPETELLESLFGNIEKITFSDGIMAIFMSVCIILLTYLISNKLLLSAISEELAKSTGVNNKKINLLYLILVGATVALGVKFVGTLLMGALVIVPAASAKNISKNIRSYYLYSITIGVSSTVIGAIIANAIHIQTGPTVVLTSIIIFIATYIMKTLSK